MLNRRELRDLRLANPVTVKQATELAVAVDLHSRVFYGRPWDAATTAAPVPASQRRVVTRRRLLLLAGAAAFVVVLTATPALGLIRDVLPFWSAPKAPENVQVEFSSMNTGAPARMSPQALAGDTREIGQFRFGGRTHTLWVAPAKQGGFCFEWVGGWGGCNTIGDTFAWNGDLVIPAGVAAPSTATDATPVERLKAVEEGHKLAVPTWISGYALTARVHDVAISFSDGTIVHPQITWVSAPINAGFFAYDIPARYQTKDDHLVSVTALDVNGAVVKEQPLR